MINVAADSREMTLAAIGERYRRYARVIRQMSGENIHRKCVYLNRLFTFLGPPETANELFARLVPKTIDTFLLEYARHHGAGSRGDMHTALRAFLRFAAEERFLPRDLSALVPTVRRRALARLPRALPEFCIAALESRIDRDGPDGCRDAAIVCLLSTYGVRGAQIRRLRLEHLDWENAQIRFPACKGGRPIIQHLTAKAGNRIAEYITRERPRSVCRELFLASPTAVALAQPRDLSRIIHRRLLEAGMSVPAGVSRGTHGFRHAFATRMVGRVPFKDVVDMLGHRNPSSTLVYSRVDEPTLQQAALPWPGGPA